MGKNSRPLALFDFDGTLIKGDSIIAFLRFARHLKALSGKEYARVLFHSLRYLCGMETDAQSKNEALRFLKYLSPERKYALERAFAEEVLLPRVYPEGREALKRLKEAGHILLLVSASTENYMQFIAPALGFDGLLCTAINANGEIGPNCKGEEKVKRIRAWLEAEGIEADFAASHAYGDSKSDLGMLALCGNAYWVNPRKSLLKMHPEMKCLSWKGKQLP